LTLVVVDFFSAALFCATVTLQKLMNTTIATINFMLALYWSVNIFKLIIEVVNPL